MERFQNRRDGGRQLTGKLSDYKDRRDVIVMALPRGGVPVAYEVARGLNLPLEILIVRKLGLPGREELAIGAIASGGIRILNEDIIQALSVDRAVIDRVTKQEMDELQRRQQHYRGDRPALDVKDQTIILVDDGLATGASMLAAVHAIRSQHPARIVVAVPAAAPQAVDLLRPSVDEIVYVMAPDPFEGVGKWFEDFSQTTDEEVRFLLDDMNPRQPLG